MAKQTWIVAFRLSGEHTAEPMRVVVEAEEGDVYNAMIAADIPVGWWHVRTPAGPIELAGTETLAAFTDRMFAIQRDILCKMLADETREIDGLIVYRGAGGWFRMPAGHGAYWPQEMPHAACRIMSHARARLAA